MHPFAPVAQLDRVPDYESGGRTFESYRARHIQKEPHPTDGAFLYPVGPVEATYPFDSLRSSEHRVVKRRAQRVKAPEATALLVIVPGAPNSKRVQKEPHPTDGAFLYPVGPVEAAYSFDQLLSEKFSSTPKPIGSCKKSCVTLNPGITFFL